MCLYCAGTVEEGTVAQVDVPVALAIGVFGLGWGHKSQTMEVSPYKISMPMRAQWIRLRTGCGEQSV